MGRTKTHDRDEILEQAMGLFHQHGFAGTSADMLVEEIGSSRYSIYSEFGSKNGLFEEALKLYNHVIIDKRMTPLETAEAGLEQIYVLLDFYGSAGTGPASGRGCLLCNSAIEFGPSDPTESEAIKLYFERISGAFENALRNAQDNGELPERLNLKKEAAHLTSVVLGIFVMLRAKAPIALVEQSAQAARERLEIFAKECQ